MPISQPRIRLFTIDDAVGAISSPSARYEAHPSATGLSIFAFSSQPGTLIISRVNTDGSFEQLSSVSVAGNTLSVTTYSYNPGAVNVNFTADNPGADGYVEAQYYGYAGAGA